MAASDRFKALMLAKDPTYGDEQHQRLYLERIDECHRIAPCTLLDPDHGTAHVHDLTCYPQAVVQQVGGV